MQKFNIIGYRDTKTGLWKVYTPVHVQEAKRIISAMRTGHSDFTAEYARDLLPLVVGLMFDAKVDAARRKRRRK